MGALLGVIILAVCVYYLSRSVSGALASARPAPRGAKGGSRSALRSPGTRSAARDAGRSAMAAAAHPSNSQVRTQARADIRRMREEFRLKDLGAQREHDRANGAGAGPATAAPTLRRRLRLAPPVPAAQGPPGNKGTPGPDGNGRQRAPGTSRPAAPGNGGPPARQVPSPPSQAPSPSSNGGSPVPGTSGAPAEQMIEGIQQIYAKAAAGGITAKQEAVRASHEAAVRFASMMQMLARTMSEPGSNYGPEITEPLSKAGQHFQAGAMSVSEGDASLETLANMTLREAAVSPRQVPHHENELSESGGR